MNKVQDIIAEILDGLFFGPSSATSRFAARQMARKIQVELARRGYKIIHDSEIKDESD